MRKKKWTDRGKKIPVEVELCGLSKVQRGSKACRTQGSEAGRGRDSQPYYGILEIHFTATKPRRIRDRGTPRSLPPPSPAISPGRPPTDRFPVDCLSGLGK